MQQNDHGPYFFYLKKGSLLETHLWWLAAGANTFSPLEVFFQQNWEFSAGKKLFDHCASSIGNVKKYEMWPIADF